MPVKNRHILPVAQDSKGRWILSNDDTQRYYYPEDEAAWNKVCKDRRPPESTWVPLEQALKVYSDHRKNHPACKVLVMEDTPSGKSFAIGTDYRHMDMWRDGLLNFADAP